MNSKVFLIALFIFSIGIGKAQSWLPISSVTKSVFIKDQLPSPFVSFYFDSVNVSGVDTTFFNYCIYKDNFGSDPNDYPLCQGWGGSCVFLGDSMTIFGKEIINLNDDYQYISYSNDTLNFNFNIDSSMIHQGSSSLLWMTKINDSISSVLGNVDSTKYFRINHKDQSNIAIIGGYDGMVIKLSKNFGLLDFINIRDYPDTFEKFHIYGVDNGVNQLGNWSIKYHNLYNTAIGNEYQLATEYSYMSGVSLTKKVVVNQGFIGGNYVVEFVDGSINSIDTNSVWSQIPFKKLNPQQEDMDFEVYLDSSECYGKGIYGSYVIRNNFYYCEDSDCYSNSDQDCIMTTTYNVLPGVGVYEYLYQQMPGAMDCFGSSTTNVQYSSFSGNTCGQMQYASNVEKAEDLISIIPNPVGNHFQLNGADKYDDLYVIIQDLKGQQIASFTYSVGNVINLDLPQGFYFLSAISDERCVFQRKFVKE